MKIRLKLFILLVLLASMHARTYSQGSVSLASSEKLMLQFINQIKASTHDDERELYNTFFTDALLSALKSPDSFDYPFDSLKTVTIVKSPDKAFRLYTWNLPTHAGGQKFYGFIQLPSGKEGPGLVITLNDRSDSIPDPSSVLLTVTRWFGAVYYTIIPERLKTGKTVYTLLGWHGISRELSSRVVEVMTFPGPGTVSFGFPLFCTEDQGRPQRLVFRYSAHATMVLDYEEQSIRNGRKWNPDKREFEEMTQKAFLIVCDRLLPSDPELEGQYEYYLPASDVMDGYLFENGCWTLVKDIDARNPASRPKKPQKPPEK